MKKAVILLSLLLMRWSVQAFAGDAEPSAVPQLQKTTVILVGTIHKRHYTNLEYSPAVLKEIILSLKPDAILNELPLSQVDPDGRPVASLRQMKKANPNGPEAQIADWVARQLRIRQIPIDRPDREENFKKTNYFGREKRANELVNTWASEIGSKDPNCTDLKILATGSWAAQAQSKFTGPETINSDAFDSVIRIKHTVFYEIAPRILAKYAGYEAAGSDFAFLAEQWRERNDIMAKNIIEAARQYPGKRLVVITGCEHRYILRDLLVGEQNIELKEYWELSLRR